MTDEQFKALREQCEKLKADYQNLIQHSAPVGQGEGWTHLDEMYDEIARLREALESIDSACAHVETTSTEIAVRTIARKALGKK